MIHVNCSVSCVATPPVVCTNLQLYVNHRRKSLRILKYLSNPERLANTAVVVIEMTSPKLDLLMIVFMLLPLAVDWRIDLERVVICRYGLTHWLTDGRIYLFIEIDILVGHGVRFSHSPPFIRPRYDMDIYLTWPLSFSVTIGVCENKDSVWRVHI